MTDIEFNKSLRELNKAYKDLFCVIPVISDYSCTRDEFVSALKKAIAEKKEIGTFLRKIVKPIEKERLI